jgi:hypothetical protein
MNEFLKGVRGLLTILGTWAMLFLDTFVLQVNNLSPEALKIAFIATGPITVKLIWTDLRPRLMAWLKQD